MTEKDDDYWRVDIGEVRFQHVLCIHGDLVVSGDGYKVKTRLASPNEMADAFKICLLRSVRDQLVDFVDVLADVNSMREMNGILVKMIADKIDKDNLVENAIRRAIKEMNHDG